MIVAGHETVSTALIWLFYLLSQHPEVEKKLKNEINTVLKGRNIAVADMPNLPYLRMVIDEVLRLYPPGWTIARKAVGDDVIGGYKVPAGAIMQVSPYVTHRQADLWPDPHAFKPERFENIKKDKYTYYPFGAGARICIGSGVAMMEMQVCVATILQNTNLKLMPGEKLKEEAMVILRAGPSLKFDL